jgi:Reverse transcriptase (RNA-dependent DNA polymerase)
MKCCPIWLSAVPSKLSKGHPLLAFFLDIKKAFDTVNRDMLLLKLFRQGVRGKLWRLVNMMYVHIRSSATLSGQVGEAFPLGRGVAQGCPLSPLLFYIFMNDLLTDLYELGSQHGVTLTNDGERYAGGALADDFNSESDRQAGLQALVDIMFAYSQRWL